MDARAFPGRVVVLVPRRPDGGHRDRVWAWLRSRWETEHPDWDLYEGTESGAGPFNRAAAINDAAERAGDWDAAVIADADSLVSAQQASTAVALAACTGQIVFGYERFRYVTEAMTARIMGGYLGDWVPGVEWTMEGTCSSMLAVSRPLWDEVGGFDRGFVGWGFEDVAFSLACQSLGGGMHRIAGDVWHLWHEPSPVTGDSESPIWQANKSRVDLYMEAAYDPARTRRLLAQLGAEVPL
jgi:hypothetical protein